MNVQEDKAARQDHDQRPTEKPQPDEDNKRRAADMMTAYEDRPTLVLPGSGGMVSGTAVNDWLDENGNPKYGAPGSEDKADSTDERVAAHGQSGGLDKEQIEKDKALNDELRKASAAENKGEKR
ncbi:MAG TPA: hypothetical protein VFI55_10075 [Mycobacterium sp.]|nr:hypothetical protein [Mycobacterium sp.]